MELFERNVPNVSTKKYFRIFPNSLAIDNVKHVFVYLQRAKSNISAANPHEYDTFNINANRNNVAKHMSVRMRKRYLLPRNGV